MSPMESNLAIRYRNKVGNICPECQAEIASTKRGRWRLFFWNLKVSLYCLRFLSIFAIPFIAFIILLALYVL
jgi:hypothetical protein